MYKKKKGKEKYLFISDNIISYVLQCIWCINRHTSQIPFSLELPSCNLSLSLIYTLAIA